MERPVIWTIKTDGRKQKGGWFPAYLRANAFLMISAPLTGLKMLHAHCFPISTAASSGVIFPAFTRLIRCSMRCLEIVAWPHIVRSERTMRCILTRARSCSNPEGFKGGNGTLMVAINISLFQPLGDFKKRMDHIIRAMKSSPLRPGFT